MSRTLSVSMFLLPCCFAGTLIAQSPAMTHRVKVGTLEITTLLDGELKLSPGLLKGIESADSEKMLGGPGGVPTSVNAFLVRMGKHLVLVDTGGTPAMDPALGNIQARLKEAGVKPESIEVILITHFHGDHIGGLLTPSGQRAFPNAVVRVAQAEHDHWMAPATEAALPEGYRPMIGQMKAALAPYQAAGAYKPFAPGEAPFDGVKALPAPGHTPGHTIFTFGSGTHTFWAVGDIIHFGKVQFQRPEVTVAFDTDTAQAAASRLTLWQRAAQEGAILGASHLAFPGLGRVKPETKAFAWVPMP